MMGARDREAVITVKGLKNSFGEQVVHNGLDLEVRRGEIFGVVGGSGTGKSVLMRSIIGLQVPDEGEITLFGQHMSSAMQDRIGYLPEERGLYKKLKIVDQLRYFAALKNVPSHEVEKRIDFWLARMGLAEWKNKKTADLSKGMQQKIQFISTVLHDPDLLILDEPFSGLDLVNVEFMIDVLSEFRKAEKTVIFSTHLMETAERLCHDILLIDKATKVIGGSLREVKASYGRNLIALRATGGDGVLANAALVKRAVEHADEKEVELADGVDPQLLLQRLVASGAEIAKFETVEPSLNDIFIQQVGKVGS